MRRFFGILFVLAIAVFVCSQAQAQTVAAITGTITDATGAVIANAAVTLENTNTGATYKTVTNSVGSYFIPDAAPGPGYKLTISANGFGEEVISGLYMNVSATRTQNAMLKVGSQLQTVEVMAENETVTLDSTDATVGNNFQVQFLQELPVANRDNPAALFTLQPGTTLTGAVTGARTDQDNVTLDGLDVNDSATGQFGAIIGHAPVDSVQEFRGVVAGELSRSGEGGGGQYELVTRSGTNHFHGNLNEYHRDTDTAANNWFSNNSGIPRAPLIRNQFGGNIGGPIKRDKAFFFFDWNGRRDTLSDIVTRTVPIDAYRNGSLPYCDKTSTSSVLPGCHITTLTPAQLQALDPQGKGFDPSVMSVFTGRYPKANDLSGDAGDLINTAGYRFNAPAPYVENVYVGKVDYNLTETQKLFGRVTFTRITGTQDPIQFPGDPQTFPFLDKSRAWVIGHNWSIGTNKTNQASWGETITDYGFPNTYNPNGVTQWHFGGTGSGGTIMDDPYASAINAQDRTYPIPVIKDDFTWLKGHHNFQFGGTFKYINPVSNTYLAYNEPTLGLSGNTNALAPSLRPADIRNGSTTLSRYDRSFALGLGRIGQVFSTFDYNAQGNAVKQGQAQHTDYRYYETEIYFGDTWKVNPSLTISYGLRWQNYSVPYEVNGIESLPTQSFSQFFGARIAQSTAGKFGDTAVPFVSYVLGGKANNAPGYFQPVNKNFAPRIAIAYIPDFDRKSVWTAGAGIIYDHTVVNAVQYQASQTSYLFESTADLPNGVPGNPTASLLGDPRFGGFSSVPAGPIAPSAIKAPYTPFVTDGSPNGLINGQAFNRGVDSNLKTPYSIMFDFGFQREFPQGFLLNVSYVGRLGRRLLAQIDANQLIDFPDSIGNSGQKMGDAFAKMEKDVRAGNPTAAQPWFENMLPPDIGVDNGFLNNSDLVANGFGDFPYIGDFADTVQALAADGLIPPNVGMGSQYSEDTYFTNAGFSAYHGLLITLHKNLGHGAQFDFNYTWSHSIDNVSVIANYGAQGGYGFICDALRPRNCRGNSDFDVAQYFNGDFIYELPIGRGKSIAATAPLWANEVIGGWEISGLPTWHSGNAYFAGSNAFVAGYANVAPAILTGPISDLKINLHKDAKGTLWAYKGEDNAATNDYEGPVGFQVGARNNLRGPGYFDLDLGLGKTFPIWENKVNLKFRADAFNALNHPSFNPPCTPSSQNFAHCDVTESSALFGTVTSVNGSARVLQGALRLEF